MKVVTSTEMQLIDQKTINELGLPAEVLMGFAGKSIADFIIQNLSELKTIVVVSGPGNNGGDGWVIAYFLHNAGFSVEAYLVGDEAKMSSSSHCYYNFCKNSGIAIKPITSKITIPDFSRYDLVIDAIFGTGFSGIPQGIYCEVINGINDSCSEVLAVDISSGLSSDGEAPSGCVIEADYTIAIGLPKISQLTYPGITYTGTLHIVDIGFPAFLTGSDTLTTELIDLEFCKKNINLERETDAHKGAHGHLLLVGGFDGMEGAICMTAAAALETGIGLITLLTTPCARTVIAGKYPELITADIAQFQNENCLISPDEIQKYISEHSFSSIVIGPGLGRDACAKALFFEIMEAIKESTIKKVIIDGDGLFHLREYLSQSTLSKKIDYIITPHFKEAERLSGICIADLKKNRFRAAKNLAMQSNSIVLLKGPSSIISDGIHTCINSTGNPALATAGSGDVLAGIIGALSLKDSLSLHNAAIGAYIHGRAADLYCEHTNTTIMKATDIIIYIRKAIAECITY